MHCKIQGLLKKHTCGSSQSCLEPFLGEFFFDLFFGVLGLHLCVRDLPKSSLTTFFNLGLNSWLPFSQEGR
jgi:hypothetical protein